MVAVSIRDPLGRVIASAEIPANLIAKIGTDFVTLRCDSVDDDSSGMFAYFVDIAPTAVTE